MQTKLTVNPFIDYKNKQAFKQADIITKEIKEAIDYNLWDDNLILI